MIVGTAAGYVYGLAPNGYVRWRVDLGQQVNACPQIPDGWGVTGTPVVDPASRTLYVVDAFGRLHALDVATGRERAGWPVVLYRNYTQELDWGALTLVDGSVYVPTGSFCDQPPMQGQLIRVVLASKTVSRWMSVPSSLGGGGEHLRLGRCRLQHDDALALRRHGEHVRRRQQLGRLLRPAGGLRASSSSSSHPTSASSRRASPTWARSRTTASSARR